MKVENLTDKELQDKMTRQIATEYFDKHPEQKREFMKKAKASMRGEWKKTHRFEYKNDQTKCRICGQDWYSKEMEPCAGFQPAQSEDTPDKIKRILLEEEIQYRESVKKARKLIEKDHKDWSTLTGKKLAVLHHTHGCGIEEIEWIFNDSIPKKLKEDYEKEMEIEKERSRKARKTEVIVVNIR